jgi:hypothetical protein
VTKAVLDSSAIIALSVIRRFRLLNQIFDEILIPRGVYEEICIRGKELIGARELHEAVEEGLIGVKDIEKRVLVDALLDPLSTGQAEALALAVEVEANYVVIDDRLARLRAMSMGLKVIGTLGVLRLFFDAGLINKGEFMQELEELQRFGFRISNRIIEKVKEEL